MNLLICGSRTIAGADVQIMRALLHFGLSPDTISSGGGGAVDLAADQYARERGLRFRVILADWNLHGRSAGMIRNEKLVKEVDAVLAIWDGQSPGTKHVMERAWRRNIPVYLATVRTEYAVTTNTPNEGPL